MFKSIALLILSVLVTIIVLPSYSFSPSTSSTISTHTPVKHLNIAPYGYDKTCSDYQGVGFTFTIGQCLNFDTMFFVNISISEDGNSFHYKMYENPDCTGEQGSYEYPLNTSCSFFNPEAVSDPFFAKYTITTAPVYPPDTVLLRVYYNNLQYCVGNSYYQTFANNTLFDGMQYYCVDSQPYVCECGPVYNSSDSSEDSSSACRNDGSYSSDSSFSYQCVMNTTCQGGDPYIGAIEYSCSS